METLSVNTRDYDKAFPAFGPPISIGEYTLNEERKVTLGRAEARYLYAALVGGSALRLDLSAGFETFRKKPDGEKLNALLAWICTQSPPGGHLKRCLHEADFVSWRGMLTKIAATPFSMDDDWMFEARKVHDVIFLLERETEAQGLKKGLMTPREHLMTYWGFKFEQYATIAELGGQPSTAEPVSQLDEFGVVVKSQLQTVDGPLQLVYSGEVDCIDSAGTLLELKTQRQALTGGFWRYKSLKWWIQSFLLGVRTIVVGFRDDAGYVNKVDTVAVNDLPKQGQWRGNVCFNFLGHVMAKVKFIGEANDQYKYIQKRKVLCGLKVGVEAAGTAGRPDAVDEADLKNV
ncbi:unnamed protein product, partial [Mesorhabditis spiculigera]